MKIMMRYLITGLLFFSFIVQNDAQELPVGSEPPALEFPHFPNPAYAVIWRNWNLVPMERLAQTLECSTEEILEIGSSLGLPEFQEVPASYEKQMYITILRRNWHLLPYDQLLILLNMSSSELDLALKEDDFLYVKLGNLKPKCDVVKFSPPSEQEKKRAAEIKSIMEFHFGGKSDFGVPRLSFIDSLNTPASVVSGEKSKDKGLRYIYSYFGVFGDPLMNPELDPYPDGLLSRLAAHGINGVWLHVVLNQLVAEDGVFPEFGENSRIRLENLRNLVDRASQYGISVYLYINEPRAMPHSFFENRPGIAGVEQGDYTTMCTSAEEVTQWLSDGLAYVFREVPGLGGVFTITASENLTNCASHNLQGQCLRCSKKSYAEIIAGVNRAIEEGVHRSAPDAKVIVWDWGWHGHREATDVIEELPDDVWFQSVSEWNTPFSRGGIDHRVGEYSISVVGPGPRALKHWKAAQDRGLKTIAKVQFNNTWEISAIPWLPVLDLIAGHAKKLAEAGLDGYLLSWSLGGYPSPNLEIADQFNQNPEASVDEVLDHIAQKRYGVSGTSGARRAWTSFSTAFQHFPYDIGVVYRAPQQFGPANLLFAVPTEYSATMVGFPYDDIDGWRGPYSRTQFVGQWQKLVSEWSKGLEHFENMLEEVDEEHQNIAEADFRLARAAYLHFYSVALQGEFIIKRDEILEKGGKGMSQEMNTILNMEKQIAIDLFELIRHDSRIGFEASNQYYYVPQDLMEKVINAEYLKDQWR